MPKLSLLSSASSPLLDAVSVCRRVRRVVLAALLSTTALAIAAGQTVQETVVHSFAGTTDSSSPAAGLIQGGDGQLYGTNIGNFFTDYGQVYKVGFDGTFTTVYKFGGITDSATPFAPVTQGLDGNFYGTTYGNLLFGTDGSVFEVTPAGALTTLYSFDGASDGSNPESGLTLLSDGTFYGTTSGGASGYGTLFSIGASTSLATVISFDKFNGGNTQSPPIQGTDGNYYGVTNGGGTTGFGTFYQLTPNGTITTLYTFAGSGDGAGPMGPLVEGPDGNFYGVTQANGIVTGSDQYGTIFKMTPAGVITTLHLFNPATDGNNPEALILGGDGFLYGNTLGGGANSNGVVFKMSLAGVFTTLYSFGATGDVNGPQGGLIEASDGTLWGAGSGGGANSLGGVFKLAISPAPAAPVQISSSAATISLGSSITLSWSALNAFSDTMRLCSASITPAPSAAAGWSGAQTGSFDATTGIWSGSATITPEYPGTYSYGITCGGVESATTTVAVGGAATLTIVTQSLPTAYTNTAYSTTIAVSGGVSPYTFSITAGTLPAGLTLNTSTGVISGTPTTPGASNITVQVTDSNASGAATVSTNLALDVVQKLVLASQTLPDARIGTAYSEQLDASGGTAPYSFVVSAGSTLPAGLSLSTSGVLSGTPTVAGPNTFNVRVTDASNQSSTATLSLTVDPLVVTTGVLTLSPSSISVGGTTTATVVITPPTGSPTMGGTVQFEANGVALGAPVAVGTGTVSLTTPVFNDSGPVTITAFYSGDPNFQAIGYPSAILTVNATPALAIAVTPSVVSVVDGGNATATVSLLNFPTGTTVTLACGTLPAIVSCTFTPVVNNTSTMTVTTGKATASNAHDRRSVVFAALFPGLLLLGFSMRKRKVLRWTLQLAAVLALGITITGCSGPTTTTITHAGTGVSTVTVTATGGSQAVSTQFTLMVH